jgi:hypothetical protein
MRLLLLLLRLPLWLLLLLKAAIADVEASIVAAMA